MRLFTEFNIWLMYGYVVFRRNTMMAFENTITEKDLDANSQHFVQGLRAENQDYEPDLVVDGLSDSILSRILGLFGMGRSKH